MSLRLCMLRLENRHLNPLHLAREHRSLADLEDLVHVLAELSQARDVLFIRVKLVGELGALGEGLAPLDVGVASDDGHEFHVDFMLKLILN